MGTTMTPDAFKINFNEDEFTVSFAEIKGKEQIENEINLKFAPKQIMSVIVPLFSSVLDYQEKYGVDLGLTKEEE